ncbi:MAG: 3-oxoacyl-ACP reductase FabG [Pseudomonadota bacterium]
MDALKPWVLVTGGSRGIGKGVVEAFAAAGHEVCFTYRQSAQAADALVAQLRQAGSQSEGFRCDCADEQAVRALAEDLLARRGAPSAIVNNVGITRDVALMRMSGEQWHDVMTTNLDSAFFVSRHFVRAMAERGDGVVLQMSSVSGIKGNPGQTNYGASKAALIGMTRSLALEMSRFNVRVNAVVPGFIETEMVAGFAPAQQSAIKKGIPLRRFGSVREVAALCLFLASADASYMTGQTFVIDGGLSA